MRKTSLLACPFFLLSDDDEEQKQKGHETEQQPSSSLLPSVRCLFLPPALAPCFADRAGRRETRDLSKPCYYFFILKKGSALSEFFFGFMI